MERERGNVKSQSLYFLILSQFPHSPASTLQRVAQPGRQSLRKYRYKDKHNDKYKYKDKYKNKQQTYDAICFWKGDDKRSLIMKNMQNIKNMQIFASISFSVLHLLNQNAKKSKVQCPHLYSRTCLAQEFGLVFKPEHKIKSYF